MKKADYKRLGKISIKTRKKSTKNTVRGISFGMILLIPVVFLTLAIYTSLSTEINKIKTIAAFELRTKNYYDDSNSVNAEISESNGSTWISKYALPSSAVAKEIANSSHSQEQLVYSLIGLESHGFNYQVTIDGNTEQLFGNSNNNNFKGNRKVRINYPEFSDNKIISDAEKHDLKENYLVAGSGFSVNSNKEIMISQRLLKNTSLNASSVIGKKITITISNRVWSNEVLLDNDTDPQNSFDYENIGFSGEWQDSFDFLTDFTIIGVINEKLYELQTRRNDADVWITNNSLYYDSNGEMNSLMPTIKREKVEDGDYTRFYSIVTYPTTISELEKSSKQLGVILPYYPLISYNNDQVDYSSYNYDQLDLMSFTVFQGKDFGSAVKLTSLISSKLEPLYLGATGYSSIYLNQAYSTFKLIFQITQVLLTVFYIFGGIIFFTTLLNLYNSINYSVQARKNFMGMLRAIGAKDKTIPRMYLQEMVLIFKRTIIWVLLFSFGISYGFKFIIDKLIKDSGGTLLGVELNISLIYYPIALAILYIISFIISWIFSRVACISVSKRPILNVLRSENS